MRDSRARVRAKVLAPGTVRGQDWLGRCPQKCPSRSWHKWRANCLVECLEVCVRGARAWVPAQVPAKPWARCAGKIGCTCARERSPEDIMWLWAFSPHAVGLVEIRVPFHTLRVRVHAG